MPLSSPKVGIIDIRTAWRVVFGVVLLSLVVPACQQRPRLQARANRLYDSQTAAEYLQQSVVGCQQQHAAPIRCTNTQYCRGMGPLFLHCATCTRTHAALALPCPYPCPPLSKKLGWKSEQPRSRVVFSAVLLSLVAPTYQQQPWYQPERTACSVAKLLPSQQQQAAPNQRHATHLCVACTASTTLHSAQ